MDKHLWTDPIVKTEQKAALDESRRHPYLAITLVGQTGREEVAAREILRLAQRERDLALGSEVRLSEVEKIAAERDRLARRVEELEAREDGRITAEHSVGLNAERIDRLETELQRKSDDLVVARTVNDTLAAKVAKLEAREETLEVRLTEKQNALTLAKAALEASEDGGRAYCLELAESAGEIRGLRAESAHGRKLVDILSDHVGETGQSESAEETLQRIIRDRDTFLEERRRSAGEHAEAAAERDSIRKALLAKQMESRCLRSAIEAGIAHVERARAVILDSAPGRREELGVLGRQAMEQLDLAHEVLGKVAGGPEPAQNQAGLGLKSAPAAIKALQILVDELRAANRPVEVSE